MHTDDLHKIYPVEVTTIAEVLIQNGIDPLSTVSMKWEERFLSHTVVQWRSRQTTVGSFKAVIGFKRVKQSVLFPRTVFIIPTHAVYLCDDRKIHHSG